jgi:hypothetical protein
MAATSKELPVIQKTYDLVRWYVPILNRLPRDHKFALGERLTGALYDLLETLRVPTLCVGTRLRTLRVSSHRTTSTGVPTWRAIKRFYLA